MKKKIQYLYNFVILKLKYGRRFITKSIPLIEDAISISIESDGKMKVGKKYRTRKNVSYYISNNAEVILGDNVFINSYGIIACHTCIEIGNNTLIGPHCAIFDHDHVYNIDGVKRDEFRSERIIIGDNCWIGANVTILRGTCIGDGSIIGAGCVVKGCIPAHTVVKHENNLVYKNILDNTNIR